MRILGLFLGLAVICSNANAAIILTIGTGSFPVGSGTVSIDVFARSTASESTDFLNGDIRLNANGLQGRFTPGSSGTFGGAGFLGAGNLNASSSFFPNVNRTSANLNLDFNVAQLFPATDQRIATLSIDTTGVGIGTYIITGANFATLAGTTSSVNGSFTLVTAVPEPSTFLLLGGAGLVGVCIACRRRKSDKDAVSIAV